MKKEQKRAVRYHRVSTEEQANSGNGMDAQRTATESLVKYKEWQDEGTFEDDGFSAKDTKRPALQEALGMLADGKAEIIVVAKLDRLSRSVADFANMMHTAKHQNWNLAIRDLDLDTSSANGRLVLNIMSSLSEWEREMISIRTREALAAKKLRGESVGRPGMEPKLKERILKMRKSGATFQAIADKLNDEQVPTAYGAEKWHMQTVRGVCVPRTNKAK
jgi:DNA invertase Pin-like site-specific DNA recombinase